MNVVLSAKDVTYEEFKSTYYTKRTPSHSVRALKRFMEKWGLVVTIEINEVDVESGKKYEGFCTVTHAESKYEFTTYGGIQICARWAEEFACAHMLEYLYDNDFAGLKELYKSMNV